MSGADYPELQRLADRVLTTSPERLAVLPGDVVSEALESLAVLERYHRTCAELAGAARAKLLDAWRGSQ